MPTECRVWNRWKTNDLLLRSFLPAQKKMVREWKGNSSNQSIVHTLKERCKAIREANGFSQPQILGCRQKSYDRPCCPNAVNLLEHRNSLPAFASELSISPIENNLKQRHLLPPCRLILLAAPFAPALPAQAPPARECRKVWGPVLLYSQAHLLRGYPRYALHNRQPLILQVAANGAA